MGRKRINDDGPSVKAVLRDRKEGKAVVLHSGYRDLNGKITSKDKTLGMYDDLKKKYGDGYDAYIQSEIESWRKAIGETVKTLTFTLRVHKECKEEETQSRLFGAFYIRYVWNKLKIGQYLSSVRGKKRRNKSGHKYRFDFSEIVFSLICMQILSPCSKHASFNGFCLLPYKIEDALDAVYDALDIFAEHAEEINKYAYEEASKRITGGERIYFYDVSDVRLSAKADANGAYVGVKKSKDGVFGPKIQFGMLIDSMGFILGVLVFKGNGSEQPTLIKQIESISPHIDMDRVVICTDAGLCSFKNKEYLSKGSRGFIVTQPLLGNFVPEFVREWATSEDGFSCPDAKKGGIAAATPGKIRELYEECLEKGDYKTADSLYNLVIYKDRLFRMDVYISVPQSDDGKEEVREIVYSEDPDKDRKAPTGRAKRKKSTFEQRLFVSWSLKYEKAQLESLREEREAAMNDIAKKSDMSGSSKSRGYARFVNRRKATADGEVATEKADSFDHEKYNKELALAGFYCQATNLEDPAWDLFRISRERWQIEWCFRTMKTHLGTRPVYLRTEAHRKAHIYLSALSLNILRYIGYQVYGSAGIKQGTKLGRANTKAKAINRSISLDAIIKTLRYLTGTKRMSDQKIEAYCSNKCETETSKLLSEAFGFSLTKEAIPVKEMDRLVS